jgi:hypothetical protein
MSFPVVTAKGIIRTARVLFGILQHGMVEKLRQQVEPSFNLALARRPCCRVLPNG